MPKGPPRLLNVQTDTTFDFTAISSPILASVDVVSAGSPVVADSSERSTVNCRAESLSQQRKAGISLARRRYQKGTVIKRGTREKVWVGRWLEDVILSDGTIKRVHKSEVLGSVKDFPTKRLAQRELDGRVSVVNSPNYRARPTATFSQLTEKWKMLVMVNHEDSTQRSEKSDIKALVSRLETFKSGISGANCSKRS